MSNTRDNNLISRLERTDLGFSGLWSGSIKLGGRIFFFNSSFPDDLFFNKLASITSLNEMEIGQSLDLFERNHTKPYFYLFDKGSIEEMLLRQNFKLYDTQHVLVRARDIESKSSARRISEGDSGMWSEIFCKAYDCEGWLDSVDKAVKNSIGLAEYYLDDSKSSCMTLYEKSQILGLYCLGTIPSMRKKGHAASLIQFAQMEVNRRGLDYLMLETYGRDNLLDFYFNMGFKEIYVKKIYTI